MENPVSSLSHNLIFTTHGEVWASFRLQPQTFYGYAPVKKKEEHRRAHQALFRAFRGELMAAGLLVETSPAEIVQRMIDKINIDQHPDWAEEAAATLDALEDYQLGERSFWLSLPLRGPKSGTIKHLQRAASAALGFLGVPQIAPEEEELQHFLERSDAALRKIPAVFNARPATVAEHLWIYHHHQTRGTWGHSPLPDYDPAGPLKQDGGAVSGEYLDEGAQTDTKKENTDPIWARRYLKVVSPRTMTPSYQVMQILAATPTGGMHFPGCEWLYLTDHLPVNTDWVMRMHIVEGERAQRENVAKETRLEDQIDQRSADANSITGSASELENYAQDLHKLQQSLGVSKQEVKVDVTLTLVNGASTAKQAAEDAERIREFYNDIEFSFDPVLGKQMPLWQALFPGSRPMKALGSYVHESTGWDLAGSIAFSANHLGNRNGLLLGENHTTNLVNTVLFDPEGAVEGNRSGNFAVCGALGSGKTFLLKKIVGAVVDRGGRFITIDRSSTREWAFYGRSITDTVVLDVLNPEYSLDPLRMLEAGAGAAAAETLFAMLMDVFPASVEGVTLSEVLTPAYLDKHGLGSLTDVTEHLRHGCELPEAQDLGRKMAAFASKQLGRVIFDASLPPLPVDAPGIVICTYGTVLPTEEDLAHEHMMARMGVEKVFGRALYALISRLGEQICFADRSELALFMASEAHHITSNPEGRGMLERFSREGRKAKAVVGLDSQDGERDFGDEEVVSLIPTRFMMRQEDQEMAKRALRFLSLDPQEYPELVGSAVEDLSPADPATNKVIPGREGEAYMRDMFGQYGRIKITAPQVHHRLVAISSTPELREN